MGILLNPNNTDFEEATNAEIYVDKTELIAYANKVIRTPQKYICVSRPRRFGKSMAANMLTAYYSKECDSRELFKPYKIAKSDSFEKYLNKYNVIHINMVEYANHGTVPESVNYLSRRLLHELKRENGDVDCFDWNDLTSVLAEIFEAKRVAFVFIIDEWDCIFRQKDVDKNSQTFYLNFLRNLLKDKSYVALAYMTGILPIKKYGEHSAINMFTEVSMTNAKPIAEFTGFTEDEVKVICEKYNKDFDEMKRWYDGYCLDGLSIYNPKSAVESVVRNAYSNYWTSTETYEALKEHIQLNFDGLKDKVTKMIAWESVGVNTAKFQNDMTSLNSADDVLTLLVHLGYLTFRATNETGYGEVWILNSEVRQEFINSVEDGGWENLMKAINDSDKLLEATLNGDTDTVAELVERSHSDNTSILQYNDENSLACAISLAYYTAQNKYIMHRELPTGKGFADIVFIPRKHIDLPAIVVELKHNKTSGAAIEQIKQKKYTDKIAQYSGEILLVGINYDDDKGHTCEIERFVKE
ncbi:MAG: putative AAA-ATPase [Firmicutes bacterium ADurb.BinA205]|nr:MAG: putative AAA-ATPase [Firmicutes bacterium ADurb.BinA205]